MKSKVYLIPSLLDDEAIETIPPYIIDAVKDCHIFFVENERTTRRYLKKIWKEIVIDAYEWHVIDNAKYEKTLFKTMIAEGKNIGLISEAGCPAIADPGQELIAIAQELDAEVKPLVGPDSIILALMASGMNGQHFRFAGYLPINEQERSKVIKELETESQKIHCTQIFIETPYRNNQLLHDILLTARPNAYLCIASDLTSLSESVKTKKISEWKKATPDLHKHPTIFLLYAGL